MTQLTFVVDDYGICSTPCPFGYKNPKSGSVSMIGSTTCDKCPNRANASVGYEELVQCKCSTNINVLGDNL